MSEHLVISLGSTSNQAVRETISRMKEPLDDAKCNLASVQEQMKHRVDRARHVEEWIVSDCVLLSKQNLQMFSTTFTAKIEETLGGPIQHHQNRQSSCFLVGSASQVVDSSNVSCTQFKSVHPTSQIQTRG